jgi:hypothetical protein
VLLKKPLFPTQHYRYPSTDLQAKAVAINLFSAEINHFRQITKLIAKLLENLLTFSMPIGILRFVTGSESGYVTAFGNCGNDGQ